ncbi:MAG: MarR family winged helix-turn-helix transcriptional regulator [Opitutales bacterium]
MTDRRGQLTQGLGFLIADLNRLIRKEFDRRVRSLGMTRAQWLFILHLVRQPGCTQSELAESMQLEKITVSRQAVRLTRAGWIRRSDHAADGRAYRLYPTTKARRLYGQLDRRAAGLRNEFLVGIPPSRLPALLRDLSLMKNNLLRMDAAVPQ